MTLLRYLNTAPLAHLNLPNRQIQERHALANLDDTLGSNAAHCGTQSTIQLEDGELVEQLRIGRFLEVGVGNDLLLGGRLNLVPVAAEACEVSGIEGDAARDGECEYEEPDRSGV